MESPPLHHQLISGLLSPLPAILHGLDRLGRAPGCIVAGLDAVTDALLVVESSLRDRQKKHPGSPDFDQVITRIARTWSELTLLQVHGDDAPLTLKNRQQDLIAHDGVTMTLQQLLLKVATDLEGISRDYAAQTIADTPRSPRPPSSPLPA